MRYKIGIGQIGDYRIYEKNEYIEFRKTILSYFVNYLKHDSIIRKLKFRLLYIIRLTPTSVSLFTILLFPSIRSQALILSLILFLYDFFPYAILILNQPYKIKFLKDEKIISLKFLLTFDRNLKMNNLNINFSNDYSQRFFSKFSIIASYNTYILELNHVLIELGTDACIIKDDIDDYKKQNEDRFDYMCLEQ